MFLQNHTIPFHIHNSQRTTALKSLNSLSDQWECARIRRASDMKQSKLYNIQEKGKFPISLREPFPEGLRVAEKGKILWVVIPTNSILSSATFRFSFPNKLKEKTSFRDQNGKQPERGHPGKAASHLLSLMVDCERSCPPSSSICTLKLHDIYSTQSFFRLSLGFYC